MVSMHQMHHAHLYGSAASHPAFSTPAGRLGGTPGHTPGRTVPATWQQVQHMQQQQSSVQKEKAPQFSHAGGTGAAPGSVTKAERMERSGRGLERDLSAASFDELLQILLDLSSCNAAASEFIHCKAQLFALRGGGHSAKGAAPLDPTTPSKPLSYDETPASHAEVSIREVLQDRRLSPGSRAFSIDTHPCIRLWGACRHATSCIFKNVPSNLCLSWVRGECGVDCGCVHRLPSNCPPQVLVIYKLSRGGDRDLMAESAARTQERPRQINSLEVSAIAESTCSEESCSTPKKQRSHVKEDPCEHVVPDHVSRCLNDSFDRAAEPQ